MTRTSKGEDQGTVTVSSGAGRLLFALLLSQQATNLHMLAGIPKKKLLACIDELMSVEIQSPGPVDDCEDAVTPITVGVQESIPQVAVEYHDTNYLAQIDPEAQIEAACMTADGIEEPLAKLKAQALAVVEAWKFFFPNVNKVQELQPRKAKEWIKEAGKISPGQEATTVFGWLGGVDEKLVVSKEFPLAYVTKIIMKKSGEAQQQQPETGDAGGVPDEWREYAKRLIDKGVGSHVSKDI